MSNCLLVLCSQINLVMPKKIGAVLDVQFHGIFLSENFKSSNVNDYIKFCTF